MFFFKKKKKEETASVKEAIPIINKEELIDKAENIVEKLSSLEGKDRLDAFNELGSLYFQAEEFDKAIQYYESSLNENKELGKAYTDLLKLYNIKRRQAAESRDGDLTRIYFDKINEIMQLSKDVIRGRI